MLLVRLSLVILLVLAALVLLRPFSTSYEGVGHVETPPESVAIPVPHSVSTIPHSRSTDEALDPAHSEPRVLAEPRSNVLRPPATATNRQILLGQASVDPTTIPTTLPPHEDRNNEQCTGVAEADRVVGDWRREVREVCHDPATNIRIREYVQRSFEYKPQLFLFENVDFEYFNGGVLPNPCPRGTYFEEERSNVVQPWAQGEDARREYVNRPVRLISDRTIIRIHRFDVYNIYEAFHAYLNTYFLLQVLELNQTEVQFVFVEDDCGDSDKDAMWWNSMNRGRFPIVYTKNHGQHNRGMVDGIAYRFRRAVRASSTGTSITCSNHPPLPGRSADHHCKSSAFRAAVAWLRSNFDDKIRWTHARPHPNGKIVVLWSSRRPYQRDFLYKHVPRQLPREDQFIVALQRELGPQYDVRNVNFGALNPHEAVEAASNADVMVGVHGAGLTWASFLPRHGALIELFGGDRGSNNRHYHNIASLADLHYRSLQMWGANLDWEPHLKTIKRLFLSIPPMHSHKFEPS